MPGLEQVRSALEEFGRRHGIEGFQLDEAGALTLGMDDILYVFQHNDALDTLVLMAGIGGVPEEAREAVFGQLLSANLFWGETGGCTLAWEPGGETVVLQYSLPVDGLDTVRFGEVFDGLRRTAGEWRDRLRQWVEAEIDGPSLEQHVDSL